MADQPTKPEQAAKPERAATGDQEGLIERLCVAQAKPFVFLVGTPIAWQGKGVPDVKGVIGIIKKELELPDVGPVLDGADGYQRGFAEVLKRRGPEGVRRVLRSAVLQARRAEAERERDVSDRALLRQLDGDTEGWLLTDGALALGALVAEFPEAYGRYLLTTNFDPTLAVAIRRARGQVVQTVLHTDGDPRQTVVDGCHLVHLHGYWHGYDTLHTQAQLNQVRIALRSFLAHLLREYTVVVVGYSGWDDLFGEEVKKVLHEDRYVDADILWAFYDAADKKQTDEFKRVDGRLRPAVDRGVAAYYYGIDCHRLFPELLRRRRAMSAREFTLPAEAPSVAEIADGCWLSLSAHAVRTLVKLTTGGGPSPRGGRAQVVPMFQDAVQGWSHEESAWHLDDADGSLIVDNISLRVPGVSHGEIHASSLGHIQSGDSVLGDKGRDDWKTAWSRAHGRKDPGGRFAAPDDGAKMPIVDPTKGIAVHVTRWPLTREEFSPEGVVQGHWVKVGSFGGTYLVKLEPDGTLTEAYIFDLTRRWRGRWWLSEGVLHLWIGSWKLRIPGPSASSERLEEVAAWPETLAPLKSALQERLLHRAWEENSYAKLGADGQPKETPFLVAHVFPRHQPPAEVAKTSEELKKAQVTTPASKSQRPPAHTNGSTPTPSGGG